MVCDMNTVCLGLVLCELKTLSLKCYFICDIPPVHGLELLRMLRMKSYSEPVDVDGVNTPCKLQGLKCMY